MKQFEKEFIDFFAGVTQSFGLDPLSSRLVGMIFIEPEAVSMESLAEKTGYSISSLSNKLRTLESMKMVRRVKRPGTKKSFYFIEKDVYAIIRRKLQSMLDQYINPAKSVLPMIISKHKNSKLNAEDKKKIDLMVNYHKQLLEVGDCLEKHIKELERI
jgi:DNA-binding transcriptional regulator GbsR (MarR family)